MQNAKVISLTALPELLKKLSKQRKKIVTYNGSFDLLHIGHIRSVRQAKQQGDVLFILLNSDVSIKKYKGPSRPIISEKERAETIAALADVDYVVLFDDINPKKVLAIIKPAIHCNGSDWGKNCVEKEVVEENGGEIYILHWEKGYSTTKLIENIIKKHNEKDNKAVFIDRDGTINDNANGYIYDIKDFKFLPGVIKALQRLSKTEYKLIVITNQSGIGRGYYSLHDYEKLTRCMLKEFKKYSIRIDRVYYCPHKPEDACLCRKPNIGLLLQAVKDFGISLSKSWIVGDDVKDVLMGRVANLKTIKIGAKMPKGSKLEPHYYAKSLLDAASVILK